MYPLIWKGKQETWHSSQKITFVHLSFYRDGVSWIWRLSCPIWICHITEFLDIKEGHGSFLTSECHCTAQWVFSFQTLSENTNFFLSPTSTMLVNQQLLRLLILYQLSLSLNSVSLVSSIHIISSFSSQVW